MEPARVVVAVASIALLGVTSFTVCYQVSARTGAPATTADSIAPSTFLTPGATTPEATISPSPIRPVRSKPRATTTTAPAKKLLRPPVVERPPVKKTVEKKTVKHTVKKTTTKKKTTAKKPAAKKPAAKKPANAAPAFRRLVSHATGLCLDSNENGDVYGLGCNNGTYQDWYADPAGSAASKLYRLRDRHTGRCLSHGRPADPRDVLTVPCSSSDAQQTWKWTGTNASSVWVHVADGEILDGNENGDIYLEVSNGGAYQHWTLSA